MIRIPATKITIVRAEGPARLCDIPHVFEGDLCWAHVEAFLFTSASSAPRGGGYDKHDVTIEFGAGTDAPMSYRTRYDLSFDGNSRLASQIRHWLIWDLEGTLISTELVDADAVKLADELTPANIAATGRRVEIADTERLIEEMLTKDQDAPVDVRESTALELGIPAGPMPRRDLIAARRRYVQRMLGDGVPSSIDRAALEAERAKLLARVAEIDATLAGEAHS